MMHLRDMRQRIKSITTSTVEKGVLRGHVLNTERRVKFKKDLIIRCKLMNGNQILL